MHLSPTEVGAGELQLFRKPSPWRSSGEPARNHARGRALRAVTCSVTPARASISRLCLTASPA